MNFINPMYLTNPPLVFILEFICLLDFGINWNDLISGSINLSGVLLGVFGWGLEADELGTATRLLFILFLLDDLFQFLFVFVHFLLIYFLLHF